MNRRGSIMLMCMMMLTLVVGAMHTSWYCMQTMVAVVMQKKRIEQLAYMAEGVMDYCMVFCKDNYSLLQAHGGRGATEWHTALARSFCAQTGFLEKGEVALSVSHKQIEARVTLCDRIGSYSVECLLKECEKSDGSKGLIVDEWRPGV